LIGGLQEDKEEGLAMLARDPLAMFSASTAWEVRLIRSENRPNLNISKLRTLKPVSSTFASVELLSGPSDLKASEALCIHSPVYQVWIAQLRDSLIRER
jgi:hypothetical protein